MGGDICSFLARNLTLYSIYSFAMGLTDEMGFGTQVWHAKILELAIAQWTKNITSFSK